MGSYIIYFFDCCYPKTRKNVEGTLFVYKSDSHGFVIMNRLGIENLNVSLNDDNLDIQLLGNYIVYRNKDGISIRSES